MSASNLHDSWKFIIDDTEHPIRRLKDQDRQQNHYSGKKKRHTVTNNVISEQRGKVVFLSDTYRGRVHFLFWR